MREEATTPTKHVLSFYPSLWHGMDTIDPKIIPDWKIINGRWFIGCFTVQPHNVKGRATALGFNKDGQN